MTAPCVGRSDLYDAAMHDAAAYEYAAALCATCPQRAECGDEGREHGLTGVYGGMRLAGGRPTRAAIDSPRIADRPPKPYQGDCEVDGCEREAHARGYCYSHYRKWRQYGDPLHNLARVCSTCGDGPLHPRNKSGLCRTCRRATYERQPHRRQRPRRKAAT